MKQSGRLLYQLKILRRIRSRRTILLFWRWKDCKRVDKMEDIQFENLYKQYKNRIIAYISKRISSQEDAEELTGDIFLNLYKNRGSYEKEKSSMETWLFAITNNRLKNYYRDRKDEILTNSVEIYESSCEISVEKEVFQRQMKEDISWALQRLSERERKILVKKYYQGKGAREIAEEMQITEGNVRVIAKRSLDKLKRIINERLGGNNV
ncbi:sigma-70 family RNA polymerase sigma factor [Blautia hydrogenotrophica]|uniref:RNA polymerase sigma factor n=1 Tax=Blautia hydrogenotrophica TaxID=53443 RepID=UPI002E8E4989|nr:sigma-70 family RNA polymerase sigma factor [Blautia hydrogenotrophica]